MKRSAGVYRQVMPDHEIIGIDARTAANAGGTVHCLTMQIPADPDAIPQGLYDVPGGITPTMTKTATSGEGCEGRCLLVSLRACLDTSPFWN
jgi:hypothetical protein